MPDERQLTEDLYGEGAISRRERDAALRAADRRECVFCDITAGRAPVDLVEDCGNVWIFRPLNPVTPGHVLVVPMAHIPDATTNPAWTAETFRVAASYAANFVDDDVNLITSAGVAATQTVFHLHVHVVPRRDGDGLALPWSSPPPASTDGDT